MEQKSRLIPKNKKGHKIHIKPENKGKFTQYCGGNVTQECINRGKRSSSPTIRKRATFAANARKWKKKHQEGGPIIFEDGYFNLDPQYIVTEEDLQEMRSNPENSDLFDRYKNKFLLNLYNNIY